MELEGSMDVKAVLASLGVGDIGTFSVTNLPDPTLTPRRTAWASDLFGVGGRIVSEAGYWKPVRPLAVGSMAVTDFLLQPLVYPTTLIMTGNIGLSATNNITFSTVGAYPGMRQRITRKATGAGILLTNGVGLPLNNWQDWEFDGTNFYQTGSGGLL